MVSNTSVLSVSVLALLPSLHHSKLFIIRLHLPFHFTSLIFHWNLHWKAPNPNELPQVRREHWQTLNSKGTEVLSAYKELIRLLLEVFSKSLLQNAWAIIRACQGYGWEAMSDPDLGYSSLILPPQSQQRCSFVHGEWIVCTRFFLCLCMGPSLVWGSNPGWAGPQTSCVWDTVSWWHTWNKSCVLHTAITPWWNHGNLCWCPGGHTQLQGVEGFKLALGMLQWLDQGKEQFPRQVSPNFPKYVLNIWFMH